MEPIGLPAAILRRLNGETLIDKTFSETARTYFCPAGKGLYLRVNGAGKERDNALMTEYFYRRGLGPQVVEYVSDGERDYLLTAAVPGENAISHGHLAQPEKLAKALGQAFRALHEIRDGEIPVKGFASRFVRETKDFLTDEVCKELTGEEFERRYGMTEEEALALLPAVHRWEGDFSLIHGDACLPNVMFQEFAFTGFIDLGDACLGDRHYDLAATLWSLSFNLKTDAYNGLFLDAYGRDYVEEERLRLCGLSQW